MKNLDKFKFNPNKILIIFVNSKHKNFNRLFLLFQNSFSMMLLAFLELK